MSDGSGEREIAAAQLATLRAASFRRLWSAARRLLEQRGLEIGDATVGLTQPSAEERHAIAGLLGRPRMASAHLRVRLRDLDDALRHGPFQGGLVELLTRLDGPLRDRSGAEAEAERRLADMSLAGRSCRSSGEAWFDGWWQRLVADGTLRKLANEDRGGLVEVAARVLDRLPTPPVPIAVLAADVTGNPKALGPGRLSTLVLRALAARADVEMPVSAGARRALWERYGVVEDDLSSVVLVLNLPASGPTRMDAWLREAAAEGIPRRITLFELVRYAPTVQDVVVHLCENPAVVRAASTRLGLRAGPLVCSEGRPSVAFDVLLDALARGGCEFAYHGDFDWPGMAIAASVLRRHAAKAWRMSAVDYERAAGRATGDDPFELEGAALDTPWDDGLARSMLRENRTIFEEQVLDELLGDLEGGASPASGAARMGVADLVGVAACAHRARLRRSAGSDARPFPQMLMARRRERARQVAQRLGATWTGGDGSRTEEGTERLRGGDGVLADVFLDVGGLRGRVPLAFRLDRPSRLGTFAYAPGVLRDSSRGDRAPSDAPTQREAIALCAYAELLEAVQGWRPQEGIVVQESGGQLRFDLGRLWAGYVDARQRLRRVLLSLEVTVPTRKQECKACRFREPCLTEMTTRDEVTLVPGVGDTQRETLHRLGVRTAAELAAADPARLRASVGEARASEIVRAARVRQAGIPLKLADWSPPPVALDVAYDMEDDPVDGVYLHGLLLRRRGERSSRYVAVFLEAGETEADLWRRFRRELLTLVGDESYALYAYGGHEGQVVDLLAARAADPDSGHGVAERLVDIHEAVKASVVLPIPSRSLKEVARFIGFPWPDLPFREGTDCLLAWDAHRRGDPGARSEILRYNEADTQATIAVVDWLAAGT